MPAHLPYVCDPCSVALFNVLHVVEACVVGMIVAHVVGYTNLILRDLSDSSRWYRSYYPCQLRGAALPGLP